jgi:molybdopterin/thiamine biosynthesis adenylyltransferase
VTAPPPVHRVSPSGRRLLVVGAGGNIGSHLVPHLGRMPGLAEIVLVDKGVYEPENLTTQAIEPHDVRRPKAVVQAERLRRINPVLAVRAVTQPVEDVPLGDLRADAVLACLDSRGARLHVNRAVRRLGVPWWIDAGVHAGGLLARVDVYAAGTDEPCMECAWDEGDYAGIDQAYPCAGGPANPPPTGAASSLGALAASLQAIELQRALDAAPNGSGSRQIVVDASSHRALLTALRRNPRCRVADHDPWPITPLGVPLDQIAVADLFAHVEGSAPDGDPGATISVAGRFFVRTLTCQRCRRVEAGLRLESRWHPVERPCRCSGAMVASGFDLTDRLERRSIQPGDAARSLASLGVRCGDVVTVTAGGHAHHLVASDPTRLPAAAMAPTRSAGQGDRPAGTHGGVNRRR